jgi:DNA-binding NtrC family response regulator
MKLSVLVVMQQERRAWLMSQLEACGFDVLAVEDCEEVTRVLRARPLVQVVLTDEKLPDGPWPRVLEEVRRNDIGAEIIVCARLGDPRLWIHVLAQGAYDLLAEPYEPKELRRIIETAAEGCGRVHALAS